MLWTIFVVLLVLWLLGLTVLHVGALIHILLLVVLAALIFQVVTGGRLKI